MSLIFQEKEKEERLREKEAEAKDKELLSGVKKPNIYSRRMSRVVEAKMSGQNNSKRSLASVIKTRRSSLAEICDKSDPLTEEEQEKKKVMETIIAELKDPKRDYNNFDPGEAKNELKMTPSIFYIFPKILFCNELSKLAVYLYLYLTGYITVIQCFSADRQFSSNCNCQEIIYSLITDHHISLQASEPENSLRLWTMMGMDLLPRRSSWRDA